MKKYLIVIIFIAFFCHNSNKEKVNTNDVFIKTIKNSDDVSSIAKWYFYCYAIELKILDENQQEKSPIAYEVKALKSIKVSLDTTKIYFSVISENGTQIYTFRPYNLVGVLVVRD